MLVTDVLPLLSEGRVDIVDESDNVLWRGLSGDVTEDSGILTLNVTLVDYDELNNEFVICVDNSDDGLHEIEMLLSDCKRHVSVGCAMDYVRIMHNARRIAQLAEIRLSELFGRWE